jgi:hypothetical protein
MLHKKSMDILLHLQKKNDENDFLRKYNKRPRIILIPNNTNTTWKILNAMSDSGFII